MRKTIVLVFIALVMMLSGCLNITSTQTTSPINSSPTTTATNSTWTYQPPENSIPPTDWATAFKYVEPSVAIINIEIESIDIFGRRYIQNGAGTGWIIDPTGYIVTNAHVVEGATRISVILNDGRSFTPQSVWSDPFTDLAVVKINAQNLPAAAVYTGELEVGQPVAAVGNGLGEGISLKAGWVSRLGVSIATDYGTLYDLIETDVPFNAGHSGGPLINLAGQVVGITNAKMVDITVEGVTYAIRVTSALPIIEDLINYGYVIRPFLGVQNLRTVDRFVATFYNLNIDHGVYVGEVIPGSPAEACGLKPGDVILAIDDQQVNSADELVRVIYSKEIGQQINITYFRGNSTQTTRATLTETPQS